MDLFEPEVISFISKLGDMMVLIKAGFMSLCHSLEERMAVCQPVKNVTMTCTSGIGHTLSSCLLGCGIGVWLEILLGKFGVATLMSCTSQSVFCCILHNFAFRGKSVTPVTDHRSMSRLMSGLTKATWPPRKMRQRMRQKCVCYVAKSAPPLHFMMSVRSTIVLNVLTPTLVGPMLFVKYTTNDICSR